MGIGKALVRGLGAGMQGYGKYLTGVAEEQAAERKSNGLMMREMALADYKFKQGETAADNDAVRKTDFMKAQAVENRAGAKEEIKLRTRGSQILADDDFKRADVRANRDYNLWLRKQPIELRNALALKREGATTAGIDVGTRIDTADGSVKFVATGADGKPFIWDSGEKAAPEGGNIAGAIEAAKNGGKTPTAPLVRQNPADANPQAAQKAAAMAAVSSAWTKASKDPKAMQAIYPGLFKSDGTLKTMEEAKQAVNERYGG